MKFLLSSCHEPGHRTPFLALAKELAQRGHTVFVDAERSTFAEVRAAGAKWVPAAVSGATERQARCRNRRELVAWASAMAQKTAPALLRTVDRLQPDALVVDPMHYGAVLAAQKSGRPWASLPTSPVQGSSGFRDWPHLIRGAQLRRRLGLPPDDRDSFRQGDSPWLTLLPWTREFDAQPPGKRAVHLGPLLWEAGLRARPAGKKAPRVLLTIGSSPQRRTVQRINRFLPIAVEALNSLGLPSLLTLGNADASALSPRAHVSVRRRAKHEDLMPQLSLFISHGGWGGIGRALQHGLPILVVPFERDQFFNAQLVGQAGVGLGLLPATATPSLLGAVLEELLRSPHRYARRSAVFARAIKKAPPAQIAAQHLERLADLSSL